MALVLGTNCGFVSSAPTVDPAEGSTVIVDWKQFSIKDTSPSGDYRITEIGWWCDSATKESNFEVGLYSDNSGEPDERLFVDTVNAKGTTAGWKTASVNWTLDSSTTYWIAIQLDNTSTATRTNIGAASSGEYRDRNIRSDLSDPWGTSGTDLDRLGAIYAVYEEGEAADYTAKPAAFELTATLKAPTIITSYTATPTVLALNLSLKNPTYIEGASYTAIITALPLSLNLNNVIAGETGIGSASINVGTGTTSERVMDGTYPKTKGLIGGFTSQTGNITNLIYKIKSNVSKKQKRGIL